MSRVDTKVSKKKYQFYLTDCIGKKNGAFPRRHKAKFGAAVYHAGYILQDRGKTKSKQSRRPAHCLSRWVEGIPTRNLLQLLVDSSVHVELATYHELSRAPTLCIDEEAIDNFLLLVVSPLDQESLPIPPAASFRELFAKFAVPVAATRYKWLAISHVVFLGLGPAWPLSLTIRILGARVPVPLWRRCCLTPFSFNGRRGPERKRRQRSLNS